VQFTQRVGVAKHASLLILVMEAKLPPSFELVTLLKRWAENGDKVLNTQLGFYKSGISATLPIRLKQGPYNEEVE
jgi:hypothetical protein